MNKNDKVIQYSLRSLIAVEEKEIVGVEENLFPESIEFANLDYFKIKKKKIKWAKTFLNMLGPLSEMSHCVSKKVACIIAKDGRIVSTGINGTPSGSKNCDDIFDIKNFDKEQHHRFSLDNEIHAEINSLLNAARNGVKLEGASLYVNYSPCRECAKAIVAAGIKEVYFNRFYLKDLQGFIFLATCCKIHLVQIHSKDEKSEETDKEKVLIEVNKRLSS